VPQPAYRPDIEGLRGIAILMVVAFHAGVPALAGGFVGVDVFFVLSGFFITAMLARELDERGEVDVNAFYARRALRLLPALLVVLLATLAAVFVLYAPIDRGWIAGDARAVALHAGNLNFARGAVDYFSTGDNPFLHTWSLAVEEQFYLVWPLLFLGVAWLGTSSAAPGLKSRKRLFVAVTVAGAASFILSVWMTSVAQPWAFFGMPTRIWEFALGGSLALALNGRPDTRTTASSVLQGVGLVMIAGAVLAYDGQTRYPGVAALVPALGAVLLLMGGHQGPNSAISRALSVNPLTWLGRMSYAWYLWHWPLIGAAAVLNPGIGVAGRLGWSGVALGLAWLTHRFIERPVREGSTAIARVPSHWLLPGTVAASVLVAALAHGAMVVAERHVASTSQRLFAFARVDRKQHDCWATTLEDARGSCEFGDTRSSKTLVLFGDSHAEHWLGALDQYGSEHGLKIVVMVKGGCPVADMPELRQPRLRRFYHECTRYREAMVQRIVAMRPTAAILSNYDHYLPANGKTSGWQVTPEMWQRGLRRTYERISSAGIPVVAIRGTPRTWFDVPACLSRRAAGLLGARECAYDRAAGMVPAAVKAQTEAARGLRVSLVDMNDRICNTARCNVARDDVVYFTDDNHLTATFSRSLAPVFGARVEAAIDQLRR
jgi:peptidoglycan/LPS O-acetylase OafA/YrhL